jgi:thiol-disulfide isomerase/thioredoxin
VSTVLQVALLAVVAVFVGLPLYARLRGRALRGKALPPLPGPTGARLGEARTALVYFFSPSCRACKPFTPRLADMSRRNRNVMLVDVFQEPELARALHVMGTPSVVEIADGTVVGYHVGAIPTEVLARFM